MLRGLEVEPLKTKLHSVMSISKVPTSCFNRYTDTIFACLRQFLTSTHFPLLAANLTRPEQWFPNPDLRNHWPLWWAQCPLFFFTSWAASAKERTWPIIFSKVSLVITGFFLGLPGGPLSFCTVKLSFFLLVKGFIQHDSTSCHGFLTHGTLIAGQ